MKKLMTLLAASAAVSAATADLVPEVSGVTMSQPPNSRRVTIGYTLANAPAVVTLDVQTNRTGAATADAADWVSIGGENIRFVTGDVWKKVEVGERTITWRADRSWRGHKVDAVRAVVTAWSLDNTPDYLVVDISEKAQKDTQRYYPSAAFLPGGLLGNPDYRTTSIVLRKVMAKDVTWTMGSTVLETHRNAANEATHKVTLTNSYYFGVFPVTQAQWALIQTSNPYPAWFNNVADRAMRPVERLCYNEIRNAANSGTADTAYDWPNDPNPGSFLGLLRARTGLDFDLPSEAQWEFAARAGNGDTKWGDGSAIMNTWKDTNLDRLGRYIRNGGRVQNGSSYVDPAQNCDATQGTAIVGTYEPNDWGIYDTAGNVREWCLDWHAEDISALDGAVNIDPKNPANTLAGTEGKERVLRGGSWNMAGWGTFTDAGCCRPAWRECRDPATRNHTAFGFRVVCTAGLK